MTYRFLIKKDGENETVKDVSQSYNVVLEDMPRIIPLVPKNIYSHSWKDQNGDDEYMPDTLYYEPAECELTFGCRSVSAENTVWDILKTFLAWISTGTFSFYSEYSGIGRQNVRFAELSDDAQYSRQILRTGDTDVEEEILQFRVTFKINDPKTEVTLSLTEGQNNTKEG